MPTLKKRINITVDDQLYKSLNKISKKEKMSLASVSIWLIEKSMELEEDIYFSNDADKRLNKKEKRVSHNKAWGE